MSDCIVTLKTRIVQDGVKKYFKKKYQTLENVGQEKDARKIKLYNIEVIFRGILTTTIFHSKADDSY